MSTVTFLQNEGQHKSPKSSLARLHDLRRPGYRKLVGIYFYGSMKLVPRLFFEKIQAGNSGQTRHVGEEIFEVLIKNHPIEECACQGNLSQFGVKLRKHLKPSPSFQRERIRNHHSNHHLWRPENLPNLQPTIIGGSGMLRVLFFLVLQNASFFKTDFYYIIGRGTQTTDLITNLHSHQSPVGQDEQYPTSRCMCIYTYISIFMRVTLHVRQYTNWLYVKI